MNNNLIKVGGRIRHANIPEQSKHQVILSKDHPLTEIIMRNIHEDNNHIGREHTLAVSRKAYWVPSCRGMIKRVLSNCINCKKERAMPRPTLMGDVPKERVDIGSKPFSSTGVDYFGPYYVKISKRTRANAATSKRYGVLFTCLTTRAVHLEIAGDMTTDAFILSLRRFTSRRGHVKVI